MKIFKGLLPILLSTVIFGSCGKENVYTSIAKAGACINVDITETTDISHYFLFSSCSKNLNRYEWDFGDGTNSLITNPSHQFPRIGSYMVRLTAYDSSGVSSIDSMIITIGHYTLTKIVYQKLSGYYAIPTYLRIVTNPINLYDTITNINQLPYTHSFKDSTYYDIIDTLSMRHYLEHDSTTLAGINTNFYLRPSLIIDNVLTEKIVIQPNDTTIFSMYFKIVPR